MHNDKLYEFIDGKMVHQIIWYYEEIVYKWDYNRFRTWRYVVMSSLNYNRNGIVVVSVNNNNDGDFRALDER